MTTLSELKELCEKATRGSWAAGYWSGICYEEHSHGGGNCNYQYKLIRDSDISHHNIVLENEPIYLVKTTEEYGAMSNNNAKFIAATDPETVLKLIETIEKLREALEMAEDLDCTCRVDDLPPSQWVCIPCDMKQALKDYQGDK